MALWTAVLSEVEPLPGKVRPIAPTTMEPTIEASVAVVPLPSLSRARLAIKRLPDTERRRLGRQGQSFDACFDLHGFTHEQGHAALKAFLLREHDRGARTVLVITGKANGRGREASFRRDVPHWFEHRDLQEIVAAFAPAHSRHGGDGALYVRLRRLNRSRA
ncbi:DNA-nicking Smr family endonuclease [Bradyrhizobium sp. USDA 4341]